MERGVYVVVVVDHHLGTVESYGPMSPTAALRVVVDLRGLLAAQGWAEQVSVTTARLYPTAGHEHPDDP